MPSLHNGNAMHALAAELFPICRSLTGNGVRETLAILQRELPGLTVHEIPSGTRCFDWTVPDEWNIRAGFIGCPDGSRIADFSKCNLHVVGYSVPVDIELPLSELQDHLHSLPDQPDAIPYVTSYYERAWGFCLPHNERLRLSDGTYRAFIDSTLEPGNLVYGELIIPGETDREVFLSTYICHPSMANNELSGPVVTTYLAKWLREIDRRFSYRIVFIPETIGSIAYLSRHLDDMKERTAAGFNITCIGDDRVYSYLPSRDGSTLADRAALHVLGHIEPGFKRYSYLDRGSDERQYCSPGADLPVASVMRSKYHEYPEYHTSLDDLSLVTGTGLYGGYVALRRCIEAVEANHVYRSTVLCEPQLGRRGLYPNLSIKGPKISARTLTNILAYCDGGNDLLTIAELLGVPVWELAHGVEKLQTEGLLECLE